MRPRFLLTILLMAMTAACGKGNPGDPSSSGGTGSGGGGTTTNGSMSAVIDGVAWSATAISTSTTPATNTAAGSISISGANSSGRGIAFGVSSPGVGTYNITSNVGMNFVLTFALGQLYQSSALHAGTTGSVTITTQTPLHAVGTFLFSATGTAGATGIKSVTSGKFDVTF